RMQAHIPAGALLASIYGRGRDTLMQFYPAAYPDQDMKGGTVVQAGLALPFRPHGVKGPEELSEKMRKGVVYGNTVTCPGFFAPQGRMLRIKPAIPDIIERLSRVQINDLMLTNFEMETAGYYAMGRLLGHEVLSLNAIVANRITK